MINDVRILEEGDQVGASEATFLNMLNISPFSYGLVVRIVYDSGVIFEPFMLDIKTEDFLKKFKARVAQVKAVCLAINYPNVGSVPHILINGFKNVIAVAVKTEIELNKVTAFKDYLKNPSNDLVIVMDYVKYVDLALEVKEEKSLKTIKKNTTITQEIARFTIFD